MYSESVVYSEGVTRDCHDGMNSEYRRKVFGVMMLRPANGDPVVGQTAGQPRSESFGTLFRYPMF